MKTSLLYKKKPDESTMMGVLQEMFLDRVRLHRKGYQHRVIKIIDKMMVDILLLADTSLPLIHKRNGKATR